ncbi:MAG: phosphate ABC transporter substrate-binding protein [Methanomicrobia archaeon]|nr:phosphate ABC transporter substrate-binding protein [Methanomicrobia archaeon]
MKKKIDADKINIHVLAGIGISMILLMGFMGCIGGEKESKTLSLAGSTTVEPIASKAAEVYMEKHPDVKVTVQGGGSGTGIKMVGEGTVDIGNASRKIKDKEKDLYPDLVGTIIAYDGIAIVVHPSNPVENLTKQQLQDIYAGKITNWKEIGGEDREIVVVTRAEGSGTRDTFIELVMNKGKVEETSRALQKPSNGAVKATVAGNESAIGYIGLGYVDDTVKPVKINNILPSSETVKNGTYPISRALYMYTKGEPSGVTKDFIDFILSDEGQNIVEEVGFIRID